MQLHAVSRTFFCPGKVQVTVTFWVVSGVPEHDGPSSSKSHHCQAFGELLEVSVRVTGSPAYGCCCSGKPASVPVGPHVKLAVGTAL